MLTIAVEHKNYIDRDNLGKIQKITIISQSVPVNKILDNGFLQQYG